MRGRPTKWDQRGQRGDSVDERFLVAMHEALGLLARARQYARSAACCVWQFAVDIDTFSRAGLTPNDVRWLIHRRCVEHRLETTEPGAESRSFRDSDCSLHARSCFIVTDAGLALARKVSGLLGAQRECASPPAAREDPDNGQLLRPHWNAQRRELRVDGQVIKRFRSSASNQEAILNAFEEEGWPPRIDDPLPQVPEQNQGAPCRLRETVKSLNRHHTVDLVRFYSDGTGEGVLWEWVDDDLSSDGV